MSESPDETPEMALQRVHQQLAEVTAQRDAAEDRFVKQRQECDEQEDEIARLTQEIDTRKAMFARLQEEYDAAKPYIMAPGQVAPYESEDGVIPKPLGAACWCIACWVLAALSAWGIWKLGVWIVTR